MTTKFKVNDRVLVSVYGIRNMRGIVKYHEPRMGYMVEVTIPSNPSSRVRGYITKEILVEAKNLTRRQP